VGTDALKITRSEKTDEDVSRASSLEQSTEQCCPLSVVEAVFVAAADGEEGVEKEEDEVQETVHNTTSKSSAEVVYLTTAWPACVFIALSDSGAEAKIPHRNATNYYPTTQNKLGSSLKFRLS
jgi:hypothetical protein